MNEYIAHTHTYTNKQMEESIIISIAYKPEGKMSLTFITALTARNGATNRSRQKKTSGTAHYIVLHSRPLRPLKYRDEQEEERQIIPVHYS